MSYRHPKRAYSHLIRLIFGIFFVVGISLLAKYHHSQDDRSNATSDLQLIDLNPSEPTTLDETKQTLEKVQQTTDQINRQLTQQNPNEVELKADIVERQKAVKQLMQDDPASILAIATESEQLQLALPNSLQANIETETQVEGELLVEFSDNFRENSSENYHTLITDNNARISLHFVEAAPVYETGTKVRASGILLDDQMVITPPTQAGLEILESPGAPVTANPYKVAVILINFQNDQTQPFTKEEIRNTTFSNNSNTNVNSFYQENSFGKYTLQGHLQPQGDVFGWYTLPVSNTQCSQYLWSVSANQLAAADGFNPNNYKAIVYAFPTTQSCAWSGWGTFGGSPARSWINGFYSNYIVSHELGHNFGTNHASAYQCYDSNASRVSISRNCISNEYGDPFDIMGSAYLNRHFSNFHKGQANFFASSNSRVITTSGDYTIAPVEIPTSAVQSIIIPTSNYPIHNNQRFYYLEFRQPFGAFDQFQPTDPVVNGVSIRLGTAYNASNVEQSQLLDMTPETNSFLDAPLAIGKSFIDRAEGVTITPLSIENSSIKVRVEFAEKQCVRMKPKVELLPTESSSLAGATTQYYLRIENLDSVTCGPSDFWLDGTTPEGLTQQPRSISNSIQPGNYVYIQIDLKASDTIPFGNYIFSETVTRDIENTNIVLNGLHHITSNPPTPTPTLPPCTHPSGKKSDFNDDGKVNLVDYAILVQEFLKTLVSYRADANCDGKVNLGDYAILVREFLK